MYRLLIKFYPELFCAVEKRPKNEIKELIEAKNYSFACLLIQSLDTKENVKQNLHQMINHAFQNNAFIKIVKLVLSPAVKSEIVQILTEEVKKQSIDDLFYRISSSQHNFSWNHALYAFCVYHRMYETASAAMYALYEQTKQVLASPRLQQNMSTVFLSLQQESLILCSNASSCMGCLLYTSDAADE